LRMASRSRTRDLINCSSVNLDDVIGCTSCARSLA
jgi:hypothetical protein